MNIVGLDLSLTATGISNGLKPAAWVVFPGDRRGVDRLIFLRDWVLPNAHVGPANLVAIEDLPIGARNNAAGPLGMLHGVIRVALHEAGIPVVLIPPASVKKYATGRGNAPKPDMRMELFKRADLDFSDDNAVDAWWLRSMALDHYGEPVVAMPAVNRSALDKIGWPTISAEAVA